MFITGKDPIFDKAWNELYNETKFISPLYSKNALSYYSQRPKDQEKNIEDYSFVYMKDNKPCAALIIAKVIDKHRVDLLAYEAPGTSIVDSEKLSRSDIIKINTQVDSIFQELNGSFYYRDFLTDGDINLITRRFLSLGCIPSPVFSSIIDLRNSHEYLHRNIRKSYKSLINWGNKTIKIELYDYKNADINAFNLLKDLHIKVSGRKTRSDESWYTQYEMIKAKEAFVIIGTVDNTVVTGSFYMFSRNVCYYGVSASIREMFDKPLSHSLVWKAVEYAKENGCQFFEMGEQKFPGNFAEKEIDQKLIAISDFKAGFGGNIKTFIDLNFDNYNKIN